MKARRILARWHPRTLRSVGLLRLPLEKKKLPFVTAICTPSISTGPGMGIVLSWCHPNVFGIVPDAVSLRDS